MLLSQLHRFRSGPSPQQAELQDSQLSQSYLPPLIGTAPADHMVASNSVVRWSDKQAGEDSRDET